MIPPYLGPLVALFAVQMLAAASNIAPPVFFEAAAADIGIDTGWIKAFAPLVFGTAMVTAMLGGAVIARVGAIAVSQVCLLLCAAGLALMASASLPLAIVGAMLTGAGLGPATPASSHVLARVSPPGMIATLFSIKQTSVPAGGALIGIAVPTMMLYIGWRGAALVLAAGCVMVAIAVLPLRPRIDIGDEAAARPRSGFWPQIKLVLGEPRLRVLVAIAFPYVTTQMCLSIYLVLYLVKVAEMDLVDAGLALAAAQGAGLMGRVFWGIIADRLLSPRITLAILGLLMAAGATATTFFDATTPMAFVFGASAFFGASAIGWNGIYLAEIARIAPPGQVAAATGGATFVTFSGVVIGPTLFGALAGSPVNYGHGFLVLAVITLMAGLAMLWPTPQAERR